MKRREGWAWTAKSSFIKNIKPIPNCLKIFYGDDYIFHCAKMLGYDCIKIKNNYIFHYKESTIKKIINRNETISKECLLWKKILEEMNNSIGNI